MSRAMKDSDIPWIGEIPEGWNICRLKDCGYLYGGLTGKSGDDFNVEDNDNYALFIPFTNIYNNLYINPNDLRKVKVVAGEHQNMVKSGDLLFLMSSEDYDGIGKSSLLKDDIGTLYLNSFCKGFHVTNKEVDSVYLNFLLTSEILRELIRIEAKGFIRINLRQDRLSCIPIMLPPVAEQEAIAEFLDRKCGEVDEMVSLQEQVIEELKAYKQSVITEAVTKGLNPSAPMKPSNIDWIGQIPSHWEQDKVSRAFKTIGSGTTPSSSDDSAYDGSINWIQSGDINGGDLFEVSNRINDETLKKYSALYIYQAPFIIIAMYGASVGNISISHIDGCVNQACCVLSETSLELKFAFYTLKSVQDYLIYKAVGGGQPNISQKTIKQLWLPVPPLSEQREIADYLDRKCADIDALIALKQQKIEELKQYKKSLIYEYVTGKKTVSN